jgi:putative ABC transport system substrate-binding protein
MAWTKLCSLSLLLLLLPLQVVAGDTVRFVYDEHNENHQRYVEGSETLLRAALPEVTVVRAESAKVALQPAISVGRTLLISVGITAARQASDSELPTLNTLITRRTYEATRSLYRAPVTAIYLEQPVKRQLQLVKSALPLRNSLTVLLGPQSQELADELLQQSQRLAMHLRVLNVDKDGGVEQLFGQELQAADTLLLVPDPAVVSRRTIKPLVLGSYRQGIPLVGYSKALVKAGALMAVHSTPEMLQQEMLDVVQRYFSGQALPVARYSADFTISVNYQLARALKLSLPSESQLKMILQEQL